jgi:hypothetical protein
MLLKSDLTGLVGEIKVNHYLFQSLAQPKGKFPKNGKGKKMSHIQTNH